MSDWHLIPWTFQYIVSAGSILIISSFLFSKNTKSLAYQSFFTYSLLTAGWLFLAYLHRNAPTAELSGLFFRVDIFFVILTWSILPIFVLCLSGARKIFFWLTLPTTLIGFYFIVVGPMDIFWTNFGWSYKFSGEFSRVFLIASVFSHALVFAASIRLAKRITSKTLARKYTIALLSYLVFYVAGMLITTELIQSYPEFPPMGGILTLILYLFLAYTASLQPEKIIPYSELKGPVNELAGAYLAFLNNFQAAIPGRELGESSFRFQDYIEAMGLDDVMIFRSGTLVFDVDKFSKEHMYETPDNILRLIKGLPWAAKITRDLIAVLFRTIDTINFLSESEANYWFEKILRGHGGFLTKNDFLGADSLSGRLLPFRQELKPGRVYLFQEDTPQSVYSVLRSAGSYNIGYLCMTKLSFDILKEKYFIPEEFVIQIGFEKGPTTLEPGNIQGLTKAVSDFSTTPDGAIILLDCLDQIKFAIGFEKILEFLKKINSMSRDNNIIFLVSIPPMMFEQNELQLLEQEFTAGTNL